MKMCLNQGTNASVTGYLEFRIKRLRVRDWELPQSSQHRVSTACLEKFQREGVAQVTD